MTQTAISVRGLSKQYAAGEREQYRTLYDLLARTFRMGGGQATRIAAAQFWALRNVDFEVARGDVLGVIGRNGAGKSTLLKILSRITAPTQGRAEIHGRLASLLEVGTGFHPELTGRENIYLNGAILGMRRAEVQRRFDEIVSFAEVERFVDTPVKRYSSGMYVRLAFSVAAHLEPDILLVDEVLAVGDAEFQNKCLGKMKEVRGEGRTVLVVSHNAGQLQKICGKALWLDAGAVVACGPYAEVTDRYHRKRAEGGTVWHPADPKRAYFAFREISVDGSPGHSPNTFSPARPVRIRFHFGVDVPNAGGRLAFSITNSAGLVVLASSSTDSTVFRLSRWGQGDHVYACELPAHLLTHGRYSLTVNLPGPAGDDVLDDVCAFTIDDAESLSALDARPGVISPLLEWRQEVLT